MGSVILPNLLNGFATGCIFVPLTTMTMGMLAKEEIGNAAGIYNLMRNLGGSIGIASIMTFLVRGTQSHRSYLMADVTAGSAAVAQRLHGFEGRLVLGGASSADAHAKALGMLDGLVQHQASLFAYVDNFRVLGLLALVCVPLALLFRGVRRRAGAEPAVSE